MLSNAHDFELLDLFYFCQLLQIYSNYILTSIQSVSGVINGT